MVQILHVDDRRQKTTTTTTTKKTHQNLFLQGTMPKSLHFACMKGKVSCSFMVLYQMIIKPSSSKKWNTLFPHQEVHPLKSDPLPRVLQQAERTSHRICKVNKRLPGDTVLPLKVYCPGGVPQTTLSSSVFLSHTFSPARTAQTLFVEVMNEPEVCPAELRKIK